MQQEAVYGVVGGLEILGGPQFPINRPPRWYTGQRHDHDPTAGPIGGLQVCPIWGPRQDS